jgi:hypothetical protein
MRRLVGIIAVRVAIFGAAVPAAAVLLDQATTTLIQESSLQISHGYERVTGE